MKRPTPYVHRIVDARVEDEGGADASAGDGAAELILRG